MPSFARVHSFYLAAYAFMGAASVGVGRAAGGVEARLQGVPLLEAATDSRWWTDVQEELASETAKLAQLQALYK